MNQELRAKLENHVSSYKDITNQLSTPEVYSDRSLMKTLNQKLTKLEPGVKLFQKYIDIEKSITDTKELLEDEDKEMRAIAQEELKNHEQLLKEIENKIIEATVEKDPNDSRDIYMEIRAGTGGEEAAIFAGDLYKMYSKFSEKNKWDIEIINSNISDHGGFKEIIFKIIGSNVYSNLKFESGTHRVQRVPNTETQGRVHTSASTVAVLPIVEQVDDIESALAGVENLTANDKEMDEIATKADDTFDNLMDLGMNVEARFSGQIFDTASKMLTITLNAKQAKIDKKLKMVELQLRKKALDARIDRDMGKLDGAENGEATILSRNELLDKILKKDNK